MIGPIATIRKNSREELRISVDEFRGHELLNFRIWFEAEDGTMRPGKQGVALRLDLLPEVRVALAAVESTPAEIAMAAWARGTPDEKREIWGRVFEARHADPALVEVDRWNADAFQDASDG